MNGVGHTRAQQPPRDWKGGGTTWSRHRDECVGTGVSTAVQPRFGCSAQGIYDSNSVRLPIS